MASVRDAILKGRTSAPVLDVIAFYAGAQEDLRFLPPRPEADRRKAAERRQSFTLHDAAGDIVAAAAVFDYGDSDPFVELSDTLVEKAYRGCGLQGLLLTLRVASVVATQGFDMGITTAVMPQNPASVRNIERAGFVKWDGALESAYESCPACPNRPASGGCCCIFYELPRVASQSMVRDLLGHGTRAVVSGKQGTLTLDLSAIRLVRDQDFRAILKEFADLP